MTHIPFVDGQVVTAAQLNTLGGAWTTYTPAWQASVTNPTLGNGSIVGRWKTIGDNLIIVQNLLTFGSTTTVGSGNYIWGVPVQASATQVPFTAIGTATFSKPGTGIGSGVVWLNTALSVFVGSAPTASGAQWSPSVPLAPAAGSLYSLSYMYEPA